MATYVTCTICNSAQVTNPFWLEESHKTGLSQLDIGLPNRCINASKLICLFLILEDIEKFKGLDWGGGNGLLTRLLRDLGLNIYSFDKYAHNIFATAFEIEKDDFENLDSFDFVIALECFEHLINPVEIFKRITANKHFLILSTELIESPAPNPASQVWWYYMPESGQHVTFLSKIGLNYFASEIDMRHVISIGNLHIFAKRKLKFLTKFILNNRILRNLGLILVSEIRLRKSSLLEGDFESLRNSNLRY